MTSLPPRISDALWRVVPAPLQTRLRSMVVKRFLRFAPAALCAVAATQITYIICLGPANLTAGVAGFAGWFAGAAVSYVISRWAWERKGRPHLLKETLPFVAVSLGAGDHPDPGQQVRQRRSQGNGPGRGGPGPRGRHVLLRGELPDVRAPVPHLPLHPVRRPERQGGHPGGRRGPGAGHGRAGGVPVSPPSPPGRDRPAQPPARPSSDPARFAQARGSAQVNGMSAWANGSAGQSVPGPPRPGRRAGDPGARHPPLSRRRLSARWTGEKPPGPVDTHQPRGLFVAENLK